MPTLRYVTCDVFTSTPFSGNQLAIVFGAEELPTETLQAITREFNYSETVFVYAPVNPAHTRRVRIFTPGSELPFAGHPTIGTAHALVASGAVDAGSGDEVLVILEEGVGPVPVRVHLKDGAPTHAQLTTAQAPEERHDVPSNADLAAILSLAPDDLVGGAMRPAAVSCGIPFLMVPLASVDAVRRARVVTSLWEASLEGTWGSELMVFAETSTQASESDPSVDAALVEGCNIRARVFVPGLSVPEDPATGSANACLAAYLAARTDASSVPADGVLRWEVAQGVEMGRPSRLSLEAELHDGKIGAIRVGGSTVMMASGELVVRG
ncbi:MAG TPA: PhzF family phenazine biosynthesis protein [Gemmatimonas sp.]|nr:PhzF family phenazine biosynthesis protein [Gemmatimonas sp.]